MNARQNKELPSHIDPASPDFDLFQSPFYLIAHADFKFHEDLDKALVKYGVDRTTYRILTVMMRTSPVNIKDLSSLTMLKRSTTSRALDRMRREGWVEQRLNENDNRNTDVFLSPAGRKLAEKAMRLGSRQLHRAVKGLDEEQLEVLVGLLRHLAANLSKLEIE